jgi:hypothetical protein
MNYSQRIAALSKLGDVLANVGAENPIFEQAYLKNNWFTIDMQQKSVAAWASLLNKENLTNWTAPYHFLEEIEPKTIAIIMAGNIPLVGLHDLISVLVSGHKAIIKLSSDDVELMSWVINQLISVEPGFEAYISFAEDRQLKNFDAVIATGSNNSYRYFEYYFKNKPSLLRKNRNSLAILTGEESDEELKALSNDVFWYFGLGCRNVSKLLLPHGYNLEPMFLAFERFKDIIHHNKYANNYTYHKSIFLMNQTPHLDNGFLLLKQDPAFAAPLSVLLFDFYENEEDLKALISANQENIQCVVGKQSGYVPFGMSQQPELWDYADGVDTLKFLKELD